MTSPFHIDSIRARASTEAEASLAVLQRIMKERRETPRSGCYFSFGYVRASGEADIAIAPFEVGYVELDQQDRFSNLSVEKIKRLARNPGHLLSGQSANAEREEYPGAARDDDGGEEGDDGIAGVSGLPALADEAMALNWLVRIGLLTYEGAVQRATISDNQYFFAMTVADFIPAA